MSAKGTVPEADSLRGPALSSRSAKLAQLFVEWTSQHPLKIIVAFVILTFVSGLYVVRHFSINTDVNALISADLPWRQRELAYESAFPQSTQGILAVVDAPTPELAGAAATALADQLSKHDGLFRSVEELGGGKFFESNGLLFLDMPQLSGILTQLEGASPSLAILAADPSLRGLIQAFSLSLGAAQMGMFDSMPQTLNQLADTVESVLAGRPTNFSWKEFLQSEPAKPGDRRRLIAIWPKLDFSSLEPGRQATAAIREAGERAKLESDFHARLRLTGPVPIVDQEFSTLQQGALLNGIVTTALVLLILWLALRSFKIVLAVSLTLGAGLAITAAVGLLVVGAFNPISLAFAVLCVGLGADFAIQFSVRYRAERQACGELRKAVALTSLSVGLPLTLAAASAAAGFMSFLPTDYIGMAELGLIAGLGMAIAYLTSMLLLPALLQTFDPPPEPHPLGYAAMAPVDRFLGRHRMAVVVATILVVAAGLPLLPHLRFDFNPLDLRSPNEEAMATYNELSQDPLMNANLMEVLTASPDAAADVAKKLSLLPQVGQARTLDSFIPNDQPAKIAAIKSTADRLDGVLNPAQRPAPPTDADTIEALKSGAQNLLLLADAVPGPGGDAAKRLAADLDKLAAGAADRAGVDADNLDPTAGHGPGSPSPCLAAGRRHPRDTTRSHSPLLGEPRRPRARGTGSKSRAGVFCSRIRPRRDAGGAHSDRARDRSTGMGRHHHPCFRCGGRLRVRFDCRVALDSASKNKRCGADARAAPGGGCGHAGGVRAPGLSAELREHHSAARPARRGRGVQDLLRDGLAVGTVGFLAISSDARRAL